MIWYGRKLNDFFFDDKFADFLKIFFVKKLLTRQKIRSYVTLGNMLPRQNVTKQHVAEPNPLA